MASFKPDSLKEYLDEKFGSDVKNLHGIKAIYEEALCEKSKLEKQLSVITTEVPEKIQSALTSAKTALDKVEELHLGKNSVNTEISNCTEKCALYVEIFQQSVNDVNVVERYIAYMRWVAKIEETSGMIQQSILSDSMEDACLAFKRLVGYYVSVTRNCTKCTNLVDFVKKTVMFWYNILKDSLSKDLDVILKQISWPFITGPGPSTLAKTAAIPEKSVPSPFTALNPATHLEGVIGNLLSIHLPEILQPKHSNKSEEPSHPIHEGDRTGNISREEPKTGSLLLPFQLLLRPLRKRFRFHFTGDKPTNSLHKPEWYLTQVLNWVNHHSGFLEHTIQPILDKNDFGEVDAVMMFTEGLLQLVTSKLSVDIQEILYVDELFSHIVDEVLLFERELRVSYDISDTFLKNYGPLRVLSNPVCLRKWLNTERSCAVERLDKFLISDTAWQSRYAAANSDDVDEMKTPECAEAFVMMLLTMTDRYKNLPSHKEQLQFLDLQLLLLDDFRIRLTQVIRSIANSQFDDVSVSIMNAAFYITVVLKEWADNIFFLELKFHRDEAKENHVASPVVPTSLLNLGEKNSLFPSTGRTTDETVFDATISLYDRIYQEGLDAIADAIMAEFKAKSGPYLNEQWLALPPAEEQVVLVVSRSACPMLEVLQERLNEFEQKLCRTLFTNLWRFVAQSADSYLYEEVTIKNHFNAGGALQLHYDMTRNLFPLFGPYTTKPENYFKRMKDACMVLNLQYGNALLLQETIFPAEQPVDKFTRDPPAPKPKAVLVDMGISILGVEDVKRLLLRRVDRTST